MTPTNAATRLLEENAELKAALKSAKNELHDIKLEVSDLRTSRNAWSVAAWVNVAILFVHLLMYNTGSAP